MHYQLGYVRVSTGRQDLSVEAQTENVRRAADYLGAQTAGHNATLELFAEPDTSGALPFHERPQGQTLLQRVRALTSEGHTVSVIVPKVDRLGRNTIDVNQTVQLLDGMGARILFLDINVDTRTPMGRAMMQIAAVFAELELARIRERITEALNHKRQNNLLTGTVPYGWEAQDTGQVSAKGVAIKRLVDNPAEQQWILFMHSMRCQGHGYHTIAKHLNHLGVPTKRRGEVLNLRAGTTRGPRVPSGGPPDGAPVSTRRFTAGRWQAGNVSKVLNNKTVQDWLHAHAVAA